MNLISRFLKGITLSLIATVAALSTNAQSSFPICSGTGAGLVYFVANDSLFRADPVSSAVSWTGILMPLSINGNGKALAVSRILPTGTPSPTYYTTLPVGTGGSKILHYWDGANWVNTGHVLNVDNIAGGGGFLYGVDNSGFVYKYDGTSTGLMNFFGPYTQGDIAADCAGNFYLLHQSATTPTLKKYSSGGTLLNTYTVAGSFSTAGGGLAVNGNNVYFDGSDGKLYSGVISGSTVTFSASAGTPFATRTVTDMASCGYAGYNGSAGASDTIKSCNGAQNVTLTATGPGPYNWQVIYGPATFNGPSTGATVSVSAAFTSIIIHTDADCAGNNTIVDTTVLYVANGKLNGGPDRNIFSCGNFLIDSLQAFMSDTAGNGNISIAYQWTMDTPIIAPRIGVFIGGTDVTLVPQFQINQTTFFYGDAYTVGGCHFRDTVKVTVRDSTPNANFQYLRFYGCDQDTVCFYNTSTGGIDSVAWNFRDSVGNNQNWYITDAISPCHIFKEQGFYPVVLLVKNKYCQDTVNKLIDIYHPLIAKFGVSDTAACADKLFIFDDSATTRYPPPPPPGYRPPTWTYNFGDGTSSNLASPTHKYSATGTYTVTLTLRDFKGCMDSFKRQIIVDSLPFVKLLTVDSVICQGEAVNLIADYLRVGNTSTVIDMGNGVSKFTNQDTVTYAFAEPGTYNVVLTANYRYCPPASITFPVRVAPFPGVNIGPDTVLCPNGSPVILSDRSNLGNTSTRYLWNTGETTAAIAARTIGTYWARVTLDGCTATDSVVINKDCYVDIPNSFTPNGDGINDYFLPRQFLSRSVNMFKMVIFNRWGQQIFETTNIDGRGWDGKFNEKYQPQGVYVYQIDVGFDNGAQEHYTGNLTLLR